MSLARQFLLTGGGVLIIGMLVIGLWVTRQIEDGVTRSTANATALYVDSLISPLLAMVEPNRPLSAGARRALDEVTAKTALGARIASFKLWQRDGVVAYSSRTALIGQRFAPTPNLVAAFEGRVMAELDDLSAEENELDRAEQRPLLEIYSPVRQPWSGEVVAVLEFYEYADELRTALTEARLRSWLVVAAVTITMMGLLFGIVLRGSRLIASQRGELEQRVDDLSTLLGQNEDLRGRLQSASGRAAALNERYLRRVSADLHDGPAQLLALASLRLGGDRGEADPEAVRLRGYLDEAMREIRDICRGLALPEIEKLPLDQVIGAAVASHRSRTGTEVALLPAGFDPSLTASERICVFRFVQEALSNAWRHAGGVGQSAAADVSGNALIVLVADRGPGFDPAAGAGDRLGLAGLRERIDSLGGRFAIDSGSSGTRLTMTLPLDRQETP